MQGKEPLELLGNNSCIIDAFLDERLFTGLYGWKMQVEEQNFTIQNFTSEAMFNTPTVFAVAVVSDEGYAAIEGEELTYKL